jgi:hypothetical protein
MGWLDKILGTSQPAPEPAPLASSVDIAVVDDPRVHHEYFVADEPENGRWPWLCRVYDKDGVPHQTTGSEEASEQARTAALAWANMKKAELRGAA